MPSPLTVPVQYGRTKPPVGAPLHTGHPLAPDAIWTFQESGGATCYGQGPVAANGSLVGTVPRIATPQGRGLDFESGAGGNRVQVPSSVLGACSGHPLSTVCSIRPTAMETFNFRAIYTTPNRLWTAFINGPTSAFMDCGASGYPGGFALSPGFVLNAWQQVVFTFDGKFTSACYINGIINGSITFGGSQTTTYGDTLYIGQNSSAGVPFEGDIGWLSLYRRCLSAAEVRHLYLTPFCMF